MRGARDMRSEIVDCMRSMSPSVFCDVRRSLTAWRILIRLGYDNMAAELKAKIKEDFPGMKEKDFE